MSDSVTVKKGFGTRMKNSVSGIFGGIILILIGIVVLVINERRNVINIRDTKELTNAYVDVSSESVDKDNEGKLIATSGTLDYNNETLRDGTFNISISTPVLVRTVEVYQWEEEKQESDNSTTYNYNKVWKNELIDSSKFNSSSNHTNPTSKPYEDERLYASELKVGAYKLSSSFNSLISANNTIDNLADATIPEGYSINGNFITNSEDPEQPAIGDIRISFKYATYKDVSVMGKLNNGSIVEYTTKEKSNFIFFTDGTHDGKYMITSKEKGDKMMKWILRAIGTLAIILGIASLFGPLTTLTSYVPILGNLVSGATGIIAFLVGLAISLVVIAISWIVFRPILGIGLLVAAVALIIVVKKCFSKKDNVATQPTEPQPVETKEE